MLALAEGVEHFLRRRADVDTLHVQPRRHDLIHRRIRQREDAEEHVALRDTEIRLQGPRCLHERMQPSVGPRQQPEQWSERRERAARQWQRRFGQFGSDSRHTPRQRVPADEQEQRSNDEREQRFGPRPRPPGDGVRRRNRSEYQERQARDVQRAMQRHPALSGDGGRVAQRMQRLADGGFLGEREQRGPHDRDDRDDQARDAECRFGQHQGTSRRT